MSNDHAIARVFKLWAKISMMIVDGKRTPHMLAEKLQEFLECKNWRWLEKDGVIYLSLTTDGATKDQWLSRFRDQRVATMPEHGYLPDFEPTNGITTKLAILRFRGPSRLTSEICSFAANFRTPQGGRLIPPRQELAYLFRSEFSNKDLRSMGLHYLVMMHEPIEDSSGTPRRLGAHRDGRTWFCDYLEDGEYSFGGSREFGFAFEVVED